MNKKLKVRTIGIIIISALLFMLPIGAIFANSSMTALVYAEDSASDNDTLDDEDSASDNDASDDEDSASDNDAGDEGEEPGEKPGEETETCTCKERCSNQLSCDKTCKVCVKDFKKCCYVNPNVLITITAPNGWFNDKAKVEVEARDTKNSGNFEIVKIEAKIGHNGSWQDITEDKYIVITENCSVYVQITDQNDIVYSKNRNIKCFDRTNPTLNAAVSNGLLTVVGYDNDSGIKAFYINGYEFKEFTNNTLNVRLQQFDTGYEYFTVQVMDNAGNMSEVYKTKNPYYDDDPSDDDDKGASTLPKDATPSAPSSSTAQVTEHTKTDSEGNTTFTSKPEQSSQGSHGSSSQEQEKRESMSEADKEENLQTKRTETGKEFYTIQTESEKVFYLIIDRDGDEEKVYFLTEIDENDLMNTVSTTSETLPKNSAALESAIGSNNKPVVVEEPVEEEPEVEEPKQSNISTYVILALFGAGAIGAWYYLKMVKGKKENFTDDDEDDDEEVYYDDDSDKDGEDDFFNTDDVTDTIDDDEE